MSDREADKLIKGGFLTEGRLLDPEDKEDAKKIKEAEKKHDAKHAANVAKENERHGAKQEELGEDNTKRRDLFAEAEGLMTAIAKEEGKALDRSEFERLQRLETPQLEKNVERLREEKAKIDEANKENEALKDPALRGSGPASRGK